MLMRIGKLVAAGLMGLTGLFFLAGRPTSELIDFLRAGASTTVDTIEAEIPDVVHDQKAEAALAAAREQLIDREVRLNLSRNQLRSIEHEITTLEAAMAERAQILASAVPLLRQAIETGQLSVRFVSATFSIEEFQGNVDDLHALQEHEENLLQMKRESHQRLQQCVSDGAAALKVVKEHVLENEQKLVALKMRRDQISMESDALDIVAVANIPGRSLTADLAHNIARLEGQVELLEARNAARRELFSAERAVTLNKLNRSMSRWSYGENLTAGSSESSPAN